MERSVLTMLAGSDIIDDDTLIIVEEADDADLSYIEDLGFYMIRVKHYKNSKHVFIRRSVREVI